MLFADAAVCCCCCLMMLSMRALFVVLLLLFTRDGVNVYSSCSLLMLLFDDTVHARTLRRAADAIYFCWSCCLLVLLVTPAACLLSVRPQLQVTRFLAHLSLLPSFFTFPPSLISSFAVDRPRFSSVV
jgi:hypothetical protein